MASQEKPWVETGRGWTAFASDLQPGKGARTPQGEEIDLQDGTWERDVNGDGELLEWRKALPDGRRLRIFND